MDDIKVERVDRYTFSAYHVTEIMKLKTIAPIFDKEAAAQSSTRLIYRDGDNSYFFIYRFGSVIFFNVAAGRQVQIIDRIKGVAGGSSDMFTSEEFPLEVQKGSKPSVGFELAVLDSITMEKLELLAMILAQSTALEYFEIQVDQLLRKTGDLGGDLHKKGRMTQGERKIKKFIGQCITTKQQLVASLYLLDKPDETWDNQILDNLYREAVNMFEIRDRYKTVDYKLKMIQENLELISDLLQNRHANFLEWAIILLIAVEIVLFVYQLFLK